MEDCPGQGGDNHSKCHMTGDIGICTNWCSGSILEDDLIKDDE